MANNIIKAVPSITTDEIELFKKKLEDAVKTSDRVIVDFSETKLICSSGIGILISALKTAKQKGGTVDLIIPSSNNEIIQIFNITRLNKIFQIFSSKDEI
ncbi:MAG TPA: STAS domain-containing protein [bacterium]|nr:STAS domain-containing protein [bacterium]HPP87720.1 STAS domain-containing protein [bacterium]